MNTHQIVDTYRGFRLVAASSTHVDILDDRGPVNRRPVPVAAARDYINHRIVVSSRSVVGSMLTAMAFAS